MGSLVCNAAEKEATKAKLIEFMDQNDIEYNLLECCGCGRFCFDFSGEENACKKIVATQESLCKQAIKMFAGFIRTRFFT